MKQKGQFILFTRDEFEAWLFKQNITRKIRLIQLHHTYEPSYDNFNGNNHFDLLNSMRNFHVNSRGWSDIGQNITTFPDGTIAICRPLNRDPAGIYGQNTGAICIENIGNFDKNGDKMTNEHKETIVFLTYVLCKRFNLPVDTQHIVYHAWFNLNTCKRDNEHGFIDSRHKTCPGTNFFGGNSVSACANNFIPLVKQYQEQLIKERIVEVMGKYFKDVPDNRWSAKSINSLKEKGIVNGKPDGTFSPTANITREEVAVMIDRTIEYLLKQLKN